VRKLAIFLALLMVAASVLGCQTAKNTTARNCHYMADDTVRIFGLDQPSGLHPRDLDSPYAYETYRGYP
jgi:hypothetical protein